MARGRGVWQVTHPHLSRHDLRSSPSSTHLRAHLRGAEPGKEASQQEVLSVLHREFQRAWGCPTSSVKRYPKCQQPC